MHVLITNAQEEQAYTILRCLRPHARRVVLTEGGASIVSTTFRGMAVYSRFVDARYPVPHFAADWLAGRIEDGNTPAEETYIRRIEEICEREHIDVIFPSLDPEVYLFAKNKDRLSRRGVLCVVPEPELLRIPLDKAATTRAALRSGFPVPRTWFPASAEEVERIPAESAPPWIVKPRFTAHGLHMTYVDDPGKLRAAFDDASKAQPAPLVQEYLEGTGRRNYYVTVARGGELLSVLSPVVERTYRAGFKVSSKSAVSSSSGPYMEQLRAMFRELGVWGGYTIQTKIDPRDGQPRLMEINARLGQHLWWRTGLGVNEPLILIDLARGRRPSGPLEFPDGVRLLDPYHDLAFLYDQCAQSFFELPDRLRRRGAAPRSAGAEGSLPGARATWRAYRRDYLNRQPKILCPEVACLASDPYPCLRAFAFKFGGMTGGYVRRAGRFLGIGRRAATPESAPAH
jgi:predicted ATP-grasp superfamily ATP-dependent carboligase